MYACELENLQFCRANAADEDSVSRKAYSHTEVSPATATQWARTHLHTGLGSSQVRYREKSSFTLYWSESQVLMLWNIIRIFSVSNIKWLPHFSACPKGECDSDFPRIRSSSLKIQLEFLRASRKELFFLVKTLLTLKSRKLNYNYFYQAQRADGFFCAFVLYCRTSTNMTHLRNPVTSLIEIWNVHPSKQN